VDGVTTLLADRHEPSALRQALASREFEVVVDNIAYSGQEVVDLLEVLDGRLGHYLQISSAAVYADRYVRKPLQEHEADLSLRVPVDAPNPFHSRSGHAYANGKRHAEQIAARSGVNWTIVRPPVIVASDDRTQRVWWFVQRLLDGEPILIPDWGPGRVFQLGWTHDIARACCMAAGNPAAFKRAFNIAQLEVYTAETWIEAAAASLGVPARYAHIPEADLADRGLADYALPIAGRPFGHVLLDTTALRCALGFEPVSEAEWLTETFLKCAENAPSADSQGYARRELEVSAARGQY
jgi:nucleoside-diphosphate-sugar epimerase